MITDKGAPLLVVFPRGQLTPKDKERMTKHGILCVEADDPTSVCQLNLTSPLVQTKINGDSIVQAALGAIAKEGHYATAMTFVRLLNTAITPEQKP